MNVCIIIINLLITSASYYSEVLNDLYQFKKRILEKSYSKCFIYSILNITKKNYPKTLKRRQVMLPNKSYISCSFYFNF
jgi:hypothetical protein